MVSNALEMSEEELIRELKRIKRTHASDPEYKAARKELPPSWPM